MPIYNALAFGSFVYETGQAPAATWKEDLSVRSAIMPVPRSHRALARDGFLSTRMVGVDGTVMGTSQSDLRTRLDAFLAAHQPGFHNLYRDDDRYLVCETRRVALGELDGLLWAPFSVQFEAPDPFYYAQTASQDTWPNPANTNTRVLANGGSVTAAPVFSMTVGSGGAPLVFSLTNQALNPAQLFTLTSVGNVLAGDLLTVDTLQGTVTLTRTAVTTNKRSWLTGRFFELVPGNNTLLAGLSGGPTISSMVTDWRNRFL